jgi:hypothetical protein
MPGKALIKLRQKPRRPKRKKVKCTHQVDGGETLQQIMEWFEVTDPSQIRMELESGWEYTDVYAVFERMQTDEEYERDLKKFQERKRKYDAWYSENETTIKMEIQRRRDEAARKEREANEKARKRLKKELAKLEKEIG